MSQFTVGVDLGGTKTLAGVFDASGRLCGRAKETTPFDQPVPIVIESVAKAVSRAMAEAKVTSADVAAFGMGVPGQVNPTTGFVTYAPNIGWRNIDLPALLPKEWGWPVVVENDVRVGTYAEWTQGAAKGAKHVLGVFAGTGVGGALILDGKLFHGFNLNAGEIGHTIVNWRKGTTLESIAGRRSLMKRAEQMLADAPKRVRKEWKNVDLSSVKSSLLAEFYQKGDPVAVQMVDDAARVIGAGIGSCLNLLSPEVIVFGGGLAGAMGDSLHERVWEIASRYALPGAAEGVRFVAAQLGDDAGIIGAGALARAKVAVTNKA